MLDVSFDKGLTTNYFHEYPEDDFVKVYGKPWLDYRNKWFNSCNQELLDFPIHVEIELNYSCNLKCPSCPISIEKNQAKTKDWMSWDDYKRLIDFLACKGTKSIRFCYVNEPLIRHDLPTFINYAKMQGILDLIITTNGTLLDPQMSRDLIKAGVSKINISLDAVTETTYKKIRIGGNYNKVMENIKAFRQIRANKKIPKLGVSFVKQPENIKELTPFIQYWETIADTIIIQNYSNPFKKERDIKNFKCPEPFKRMTLRSNGDVLPCCGFQADKLIVGNWKKTDLDKIWNGKKFREIRDIHREGKFFKNEICKKCVESVRL